MYTILIETANLMETPSYIGEDGKARYLGPGTQGVVYFTLYGKENQASQQVRIVSTGRDAGKVFYGEQETRVSIDVNGLPDRKPFQQGKTAHLVLTTELLTPLGKLNKLVIGHTPTSAKLGWYLKQVIIADEKGQAFRFPCNQWLIADQAELTLSVEATDAGGDTQGGRSATGGDAQGNGSTPSGDGGASSGGTTTGGGASGADSTKKDDKASNKGKDKSTLPKSTSLVLSVVTASDEETPDYSYKDSKGKNRILKLGSGTTVPVIFQIKGERGQSGEVYVRSGDDKPSLITYQGKELGPVQVENKPDPKPFVPGKTAKIVLPPDPSLDLGELLTLNIKTDQTKDLIGNKARDGRAWFLKEVTIINEAQQQFLFRNKDPKWLFVPEQPEIELSAEIPV